MAIGHLGPIYIRKGFGAAPAKGRVGLCRSSQVCSALRRLRRLGLALCATAIHPSACGGKAAC